MADNTTLNAGTGGDVVRNKDRTGVKTSIVGLDLTPGGGSETLMNGSLPVAGVAADGAAVSGNPVLMAGQDGANVQSLKTDADGELQIDVLSLPGTHAEDAAHTTGDLGMQALGVRRDTPSSSAGADGDYTPPSFDAQGKLWTTATREVRVTATPTISASLYAADDQFGTVLTFANVAEANGGAGRIVNANITNKDTEFPVLELWLFRASPTMVNADNGVFDITDANLETAELIGVIEFSAYYAAANNRVATGSQRGMPLGGHPLHYVCGAATTSIYGVFAIRNAVTPVGTDDVKVTLFCELE